MLSELRSCLLLSHDICYIHVCLDVHNHDNPALYTLLKKANFDCRVLYCFVREVISSSDSDCSCVVNPDTSAVDPRCLLLPALQIKPNCPHMLNLDTSLASAIVSAMHRARQCRFSSRIVGYCTTIHQNHITRSRTRRISASCDNHCMKLHTTFCS